jgi:hypothetical protein
VKKSLNQRIARQRFGVRQSSAALDFYATYEETSEAASLIPIRKIRAHFPKAGRISPRKFLRKMAGNFSDNQFFHSSGGRTDNSPPFQSWVSAFKPLKSRQGWPPPPVTDEIQPGSSVRKSPLECDGGFCHFFFPSRPSREASLCVDATKEPGV